jgi:AcrR family transcriptional regulator
MTLKGQRRRVVSGPKPRVGGRSARVVSEVLAATLELFAAQGYAGLSIEDVAARAGVNKTTVYRRWPTKADLVGAALFSLRDEDPEPPDTGSLEQDLLQVLLHFAAQAATPRKRALMTSFFLGKADPDLQALVKRLREERPAIPAIIFKRALERRELPQGSDVQLIAAALLGPVHTRIHWKGEPVDRAFLVRLIKLVVSGAMAGGALL